MIFFFEKIVKKYNNKEEIYKRGIRWIKKQSNLYIENINEQFIDIIFADNKNKIILFNIDSIFNTNNITSILVYHKVTSPIEIKYYILLLGTNCNFRNLGYANIILNEFIEWIKKNKSNKKIKLIVKSVDSSLQFYLKFGFVKSNSNNRLFYKYEPVKTINNGLDSILELEVL